MARRNGMPSSKAKNLKGKASKPLTNGEAITALETLPEGQLFGVFDEGEKPEFLRQLYLPLRHLFSKTTRSSQANYTRIQQISHLRVPEILSCRFPRWLEDPLEFWERLIEAVPRYSNQLPKNRARIFLEGAHALDSQLETGRIFRRFVAVSATRLFKRANPTSTARIGTKHITEFLEHVGLPSSETNIKKYGDILRRGRRIISFCQRLADNGRSNDGAQSDDDVLEQPCPEINDYGPLFYPDIPDSIWDSEGLHGKEGALSIQHLRRFGIHKTSEQSNAKNVANALLDFHTKFVWIGKNAGHYTAGKRGQELQKSDTSATKRQRRQGLVGRSSNICPINLSDRNPRGNTEGAAIGLETLSTQITQSLAQSTSGRVDRPSSWQAVSTNEHGTIWEWAPAAQPGEFSKIISHRTSINNTGEGGDFSPLTSSLTLGSANFGGSMLNMTLLRGENSGDSVPRIALPPITDDFGQGDGPEIMQELSFEWLESLVDDPSATVFGSNEHGQGSGLGPMQELSFEWLDGLTGWDFQSVAL